MNLKAVSLTAVAVAAFTTPALAHHSFAMFDAEQTVTLQGTVKEFEWTNPHSWLRIMVRDAKTDQLVLWALELTMMRSQECGLVHSNSFTVPCRVTVCSASN